MFSPQYFEFPCYLKTKEWIQLSSFWWEVIYSPDGMLIYVHIVQIKLLYYLKDNVVAQLSLCHVMEIGSLEFKFVISEIGLLNLGRSYATFGSKIPVLRTNSECLLGTYVMAKMMDLQKCQ